MSDTFEEAYAETDKECRAFKALTGVWPAAEYELGFLHGFIRKIELMKNEGGLK